MAIKSALICFLLLGLCWAIEPYKKLGETECVEALNRIDWELSVFLEFPDPTSLSNYTANFMAYSGRFINDFGEYEVCQNATASHYLSLKFQGNVSKSIFDALIGFCAPASCSAEEVQAKDKKGNENINRVFKLFQKGMGLPIRDISVPNSYDFYDPRAPSKQDKTSTVIVFAILGSLTAFALTGTGLGIMREIKSNARKAKKDALLRNEGEARDGGESTSNEKPAEAAPAKKERRLPGIYGLLDCFDARKNFEKLIKIKYTDTYDQNLEIFNGIRVLMMLYVVYGHSFMLGTFYVDNLTDLPDIVKQWSLLIIFSALYSVDVFFYMSGFLFAYIGTGKLKKIKPSVVNIIGLCFHRLLRFWPTYMVALLFFWRVLPLLGEGPIWFKMEYFSSLCNDSWWQNVLLLDDMLVQQTDYCFGWGWYLSNDFQMFIITPIFIWLYIKNKTFGKFAMVCLILLSYVLALILGAELHVRASPPTTGGISNEKGFAYYYVKPYIRLPPYFIGILVALWYKEFREETGFSYKLGKAIQRSSIAKNFLTYFGFLILFALLVIPRQLQFDDKAWSDTAHVTFKAFQKSLYVIGMTMIIVPILVGEKNMLKRFLCHPIFVPLARLSFTAYLVHLFWVYKNYFDLPFSFHITYTNGTLNTISNGAFSFLTGLILSLIIEVPMANIESNYLMGGGKKKHAPKPVDEATKRNHDEAAIIPIDNQNAKSTAN